VCVDVRGILNHQLILQGWQGTKEMSTEEQDQLDNTQTNLIELATFKPRLEYFNGLLSFDEVVIIAIYPITLILGHLVYMTDPEPSYFSNKRNLFNVIFVRQGWFWTTVAFLLYHLHYFLWSKHDQEKTVSSIRQCLTRYAAATIWWIFFAQWLFGIPLMDRVFMWTGGVCDGAIGYDGDSKNISSSLCRSYGGSWVGGYDPSGHAFLLTHSSLFLWFEILPELRSVVKPTPMVLKLVLGLITLWWWELLITSVYFHTFAEKVAGLAWGYIPVLVIYIFGRRSTLARLVFDTS
jgi:hypothetical protein